MKQRYDIEIAGVKLSIATEDGAEFVEKTVAELETSVQNVLRIGKNYSKLDAIILCALDYCGEFRKAEDRIRNLEAQIEILEANVRRLKGDESKPVAEVKTAVAEEAPAVEETVVAVVEETAPEADDTDNNDKTGDSDDSDESRDASFRQLEAFLGSQLSLDLGGDNL